MMYLMFLGFLLIVIGLALGMISVSRFADIDPDEDEQIGQWELTGVMVGYYLMFSGWAVCLLAVGMFLYEAWF